MFASSPLVAVVGSTDLDRAQAFYGDGLGLRVLERNPGACVFEAAGGTIRVALVPTVVVAGYTVAGWQVSDAAVAAARLGAAGIELLWFDGLDHDSQGLWRAPGGDLVGWFADPDGNVLSITELAAATT